MTERENRLLEIKNLNVYFKSYSGDKEVVNNFNIQLDKGETIGIVGESGSGKTVSMLALSQLLPRQAHISSGEILLGGENLRDLTRKEFSENISGKRISMIFQEPMTALNPVYNIGKQLIETVMFKDKLSKTEAVGRAIEMLENVQLPEPEARMNQYPHQLSGGQRQRVMIAMALMNNPDLLIADEPTTALDVTVQNDILKLLISLQRKFGMALIFISHDLGVVSQVSQKIIVMRHGEIVETGDTTAVLTNPTHAYTKNLLECLWKLDETHSSNFLDQPENADHTLKAVGLNKSYKIRKSIFGKPIVIKAVDDVDFDIQPGETLAIVGESGSGKTTLAKILNGLLAPNSGDVFYGGRPIADFSVKERSRLIQPIFQDPYSTLNPQHTIGKIISRPLYIHDEVAVNKIKERALSVMNSVGLPEDFYHRFPSQLSGGQRQRVAIARAIILSPKILICDEPTSALDVSIQEQILDLLRDIQKQFGMTLILISHDIGVVSYLADRVFVMYEGKIIESGPTEEVLKTPKEAYTQKLMNSVYRVPNPHKKHPISVSP